VLLGFPTGKLVGIQNDVSDADPLEMCGVGSSVTSNAQAYGPILDLLLENNL
jgi:hypothetical protein